MSPEPPFVATVPAVARKWELRVASVALPKSMMVGPTPPPPPAWPELDAALALLIFMSAPFHLSLFVGDLNATRAFYTTLLGCIEGHSGAKYVDFSFFGNQLTCHVDPTKVNPVKGRDIVGNHFGAIVSMVEFERIASQLERAQVDFIVRPEVQREGTPEERRKMVFLDPTGNAIELKSYRDPERVFAG